ncbi:G-protein coupled receptor Mth2-like isoform X1 [Lycorma delicatula]|uniref:G-protein coupled receptor Mth2-like isoform X1 n=1 Tax=Lycorma delicatula TaxID=130591 RepID=UPI003F5136A0
MFNIFRLFLIINISLTVSAKEIDSQNCELDFSVIINNGKIVNGTFLESDDTVYKNGTFWTDKQGHLRGCICEVKSCIRKCCPQGESVLDDISCVKTNKTFTINDIKFENSTIEKDNYHFLYGFPKGSNAYVEEDFVMATDGNLLENGTRQNLSEYCIDYFTTDKEEYKLQSYICVLDTIEDEETNSKMFIKENLTISTIFFFLVFAVYCFLPELRNMNGICLMNHVGCFFTAYLFLAIFEFSDKKTMFSYFLCKSLGYMTYFSFFAGFLWLNVMCFDVWWVFKKMQPTSSSGGSVRLKENKEKFIAYSIYAWGTALGFLIILILMDCIPEDATSETFSFIKPKFGQNTCWILEYKSIWLYFYGPLLLLFLSNIFFFVITIKKVIGFSRQTKVLKNKNSRRHTEREYKRYMVYMKLFVIMGVPWILEVISSVTIQMYPKTKYNDLWYIVDFFNSLRGLLIFVIFVMKKRILRKLNNKFCPSVKIWSDHNFLSRRCTYSSTSGSVAERRKDSVADSVASLQRLNSVATSTSSVSEIRKNSLIAYHKNSMSDEIDGGKMKPLTIQEEDSPDL